jgi:hypothetical protein
LSESLVLRVLFVRSHLLVHARGPVDGTRPEKAGLLRLHREIHP